mmetsp:Transcript_7666/g.7873  ORF Transcript_7666/g.7873 Transcript_7666/m.7873 type:complete len:281 (-) Transcript_7666:79-921(-)|eukprot:CAMPEP_0182432988 /NCGR_PEP_ID=MMETSP1167-20130531/60091_1 /TAXON_ID=2988 /ORGANISM="Mallomonas Sp, Strain CCMP3275" /LENGTH=280 /DNA_ID=CAMNT_0024621115 /DNA_START=140 /DNA_END=982 /DNA_ORIENTATION=+
MILKINGEVPRNKPDKKIVEVSLCDIESALSASHGGANSIELCSNLHDGGITPSYGLIQNTVKLLDTSLVRIHVLIRPRAGDFVYTVNEFETLISDIHSAELAGAQGIVTGVLTSDNRVDMARMARIRAACGHMQLTFHRAFDLLSDWEEGLEAVISTGCERVLTSGQALSAETGQGRLSALVKRAAGRVLIIAGAGITERNVQRLITASHVDGVHVASSVRVSVSTPSITHRHVGDASRQPQARMGPASGPDDTMKWTEISQEKVQWFKDKAVSAWDSM